MKFKRNDVIQYKHNDQRIIAIVRGRTKNGLSLIAAHHPSFSWHTYGPRAAQLRLYDGDIDDLHLHPEPDAVWASYTAYLLSSKT